MVSLEATFEAGRGRGGGCCGDTEEAEVDGSQSDHRQSRLSASDVSLQFPISAHHPPHTLPCSSLETHGNGDGGPLARRESLAPESARRSLGEDGGVGVGPLGNVGRGSELLGLVDLATQRGEDVPVVREGLAVRCRGLLSVNGILAVVRALLLLPLQPRWTALGPHTRMTPIHRNNTRTRKERLISECPAFLQNTRATPFASLVQNAQAGDIAHIAARITKTDIGSTGLGGSQLCRGRQARPSPPDSVVVQRL